MAKHKKRRIRAKYRHLHNHVLDGPSIAADKTVTDEASTTQSSTAPLTPTSRIVRIDVPFEDVVAGVATVEVYGCISTKAGQTGLLFRLKVDGKDVVKPVARTRADGSLEIHVPGLTESRAMQRGLDLAMRVVGGSLKASPANGVIN